MRGTRWEYGQGVHLLLQILAKLFNRSSFADAKPNLASNVCGPGKDMGKVGKDKGKTRIRAGMDMGKVNRDMGKADGKEWASRLQEWAADWSWWLPVEAHLGKNGLHR